MAEKTFMFRLDDPQATVEVEGKTYRSGDTFDVPKGWAYDEEFSKFVKRPSFSYETRRKVRNVKTGASEWSIDVKRVSLPVIES